MLGDSFLWGGGPDKMIRAAAVVAEWQDGGRLTEDCCWIDEMFASWKMV